MPTEDQQAWRDFATSCTTLIDACRTGDGDQLATWAELRRKVQYLDLIDQERNPSSDQVNVLRQTAMDALTESLGRPALIEESRAFFETAWNGWDTSRFGGRPEEIQTLGIEFSTRRIDSENRLLPAIHSYTRAGDLFTIGTAKVLAQMPRWMRMTLGWYGNFGLHLLDEPGPDCDPDTYFATTYALWKSGEGIYASLINAGRAANALAAD